MDPLIERVDLGLDRAMNRTFSFDVGGQSAKSMAVAVYGAKASRTAMRSWSAAAVLAVAGRRDGLSEPSGWVTEQFAWIGVRLSSICVLLPRLRLNAVR